MCLAIFFGPSFVREDSATGFTIYKHKNEAEVEKEVRSPQCATMLQNAPRSSPIHISTSSRGPLLVGKKNLTVFFKDLVAKCTNVCVTSASTLKNTWDSMVHDCFVGSCSNPFTAGMMNLSQASSESTCFHENLMMERRSVQRMFG